MLLRSWQSQAIPLSRLSLSTFRSVTFYPRAASIACHMICAVPEHSGHEDLQVRSVHRRMSRFFTSMGESRASNFSSECNGVDDEVRHGTSPERRIPAWRHRLRI